MARRSSQEWQVIIEQQEASGLSVVDFCRRHQLDNKYFHARKRSWLKRQQRKHPTAFVKVTKVATQSPMMTLKIGDATLLLPAHTEPMWLAQLLKAVAA